MFFPPIQRKSSDLEYISERSVFIFIFMRVSVSSHLEKNPCSFHKAVGAQGDANFEQMQYCAVAGGVGSVIVTLSSVPLITLHHLTIRHTLVTHLL